MEAFAQAYLSRHQILSVTLFEKTPILQALQVSGSRNELLDSRKQLNLWDF